MFIPVAKTPRLQGPQTLQLNEDQTLYLKLLQFDTKDMKLTYSDSTANNN